MAGYSKLFSSIVTSSLWGESHTTVRVFIAMLATCDATGFVPGSVPGFAHLARVTREEMEQAVERLSAPDPDSRTPDSEGRRILVVQGGWQLVNYQDYRDRHQSKDGSRAESQRAYRSRQRNGGANV